MLIVDQELPHTFTLINMSEWIYFGRIVSSHCHHYNADGAMASGGASGVRGYCLSRVNQRVIQNLFYGNVSQATSRVWLGDILHFCRL